MPHQATRTKEDLRRPKGHMESDLVLNTAGFSSLTDQAAGGTVEDLMAHATTPVLLRQWSICIAKWEE
jgi:hypothetical protein